MPLRSYWAGRLSVLIEMGNQHSNTESGALGDSRRRIPVASREANLDAVGWP